jgi:hypothetical protein
MGGNLARFLSGMSRVVVLPLAVVLALGPVLGQERSAQARLFQAPVLRPVPRTLSLEGSPAERYARMDRESCEAELDRRGIPFVQVDEARGVLAPVRLDGPLHGVTFTMGLAPDKAATTPWEILDCRLALALDDFSALLATHDIVEVVHLSMYRPPSTRWPEGKLGSRHSGALAIDAAVFVKRDGTKLDVLHDFHGRIGAHTCGPGTGPRPATPEALELRQIVCQAAEEKLFNSELTPDYNWPHRNHFHLEVTPGVKWFFVH